MKKALGIMLATGMWTSIIIAMLIKAEIFVM